MDEREFRRVIEILKGQKRNVQRARALQGSLLLTIEIGAMPNHINRSSLFAPIRRGQRQFHKRTVLVSRSDCTLEYTGEQLDEADADLLMVLLYLSKDTPLGEPVFSSAYTILKTMGRHTGKSQYDWLLDRMRALGEATLYIEARRKDGQPKYRFGRSELFHIVSGFYYDERSKSYHYILDPRWVLLFSNNEFGLIDWDRRLSIKRGKDMAKTMQRLLSASNNPVQYFRLDWLKEKMQSRSRLNDFKRCLGNAMAELERVGVVDEWSLAQDSLVVKPSPRRLNSH